MRDYAGKSVAVMGMARTGIAVARALTGLGARVVLYDRKPEHELADAADEARRLGADVRAGTDEVDFSGIEIFIPSPGVPANAPAILEARRQGVEVISEIELAFDLARAPIVAITGTNGKTTTTVLIGRMLQQDGIHAFIAGNVAAGDIRMPLVTAAVEANEQSVIVAEISTFQLEWINSFRPKVAALLNITSDHLDRHSDVDEYAGLKARIFENQAADDFAVVNAENPAAASLATGLSARVLSFARKSEVHEGAFIRGGDLIVRMDGVETPVCAISDIRLRGEHNTENVLAAACAAAAMGCAPESMRAAVRAFEPIEHRLEPVAVIDGVEYINNSMCTNVDAAVRSVEAFDEPQIVIAGGRDKGGHYAALGEAFLRKARHVILMGADGYLIRYAAEQSGFHALSDAGSMREALEIARELARPGDVVVLTPGCSSFDMFSSFEERGSVFKKIVREFQGEERTHG